MSFHGHLALRQILPAPVGYLFIYVSEMYIQLGCITISPRRNAHIRSCTRTHIIDHLKRNILNLCTQVSIPKNVENEGVWHVAAAEVIEIPFFVFSFTNDEASRHHTTVMDSEESRVVLCMYEALFLLFISIRFEDISSYLFYCWGGLG